MKILMVCLGNICRSPLAEGILKHKVKENQLNWEIASAGTGGYHTGEPPHKLSQKVALHNGIDISSQCARQFKATNMLSYDYIYVMDASNYQDVKRMSGKYWDPSKTDLLLNELYPGQHRGVPDPWYGGEEGYHEVFNMIDKACDNIILKFKA